MLIFVANFNKNCWLKKNGYGFVDFNKDLFLPRFICSLLPSWLSLRGEHFQVIASFPQSHWFSCGEPGIHFLFYLIWLFPLCFFAPFWSHWFSSKEPGIPLRFSLIFPFSFWQFSFALRFLLTGRSLFNSIQPFEFM